MYGRPAPRLDSTSQFYAKAFYVMFSNMADNNPVIISFKTAYQIFKKLNLNDKRLRDQGKSDFEVIEDILHHERVELINFSDENLDPEILVSSKFHLQI